MGSIMAVSNMKYKRVAQTIYDAHDSWWVLAFFVAVFAFTGFALKGFVGWGIGGVIGFGVLYAIGSWWPNDAIEIEWSDIVLAVNNYASLYRPGVGGIKFMCKGRKFFFENRKVFCYTEDKQFIVWYKTNHWADVLDEDDDAFFAEICGKAPVRDVGLEKSKTFLIPQQEGRDEVLEACLILMKHFIAKSGGSVENVTARDDFWHSSLWVNSQYQAVSPVPIVGCNFKGKKDGRPVIALTERKGYWILHEDGKLEAFTDFDAWWNPAD
jgi:hypothetical protein